MKIEIEVMQCRCIICQKEYINIDSDSVFIAIFCSDECELEDYKRLMEDEYNECGPNEYLKDDMSNL